MYRCAQLCSGKIRKAFLLILPKYSERSIKRVRRQATDRDKYLQIVHLVKELHLEHI